MEGRNEREEKDKDLNIKIKIAEFNGGMIGDDFLNGYIRWKSV